MKKNTMMAVLVGLIAALLMSVIPSASAVEPNKEHDDGNCATKAQHNDLVKGMTFARVDRDLTGDPKPIARGDQGQFKGGKKWARVHWVGCAFTRYKDNPEESFTTATTREYDVVVRFVKPKGSSVSTMKRKFTETTKKTVVKTYRDDSQDPVTTVICGTFGLPC